MTNYTNYVDEARQVIDKIKNRCGNRIDITTSQIRKFLSQLNSVYNKYTALEADGRYLPEQLDKQIVEHMMAVKVSLIYQCARSEQVKKFCKDAQLLEKIEKIKTWKDFQNFFKYVQALVAYHKFEGGRD